MQKLFSLLLIVAIGVVVFLGTRWWYQQEDPPKEEVSATVLLERIQPVLKLITVEGEFSELYDHKDSWTYHRAVAGLPAFQKKAILKVNARASVGYDLEGMRLETDEQRRTITLQLPSQPQLLSLEHDVDYYDITEGIFNRFSPRELSMLNAKAKQEVLRKVPESGLFQQAERERGKLIETIRSIVEQAGWQFQLDLPLERSGNMELVQNF